MITYIIRRLLLMIPTLIGITIMVFLIARFAPGNPASTQMDVGQMSAEAQKEVREWYEKRYGLDLPLWQQYLRWWKGMFTAEIQTMAWMEGDTLTPIFTSRKSDPELYVKLPDGSWRIVTGMTLGDQLFEQQDEVFTALVDPSAEPLLPEILPDYAMPRHLLVEADLIPMNGDLAMDRLEFSRELREIEVEAPAWADIAGMGYELFIDPNDPDGLIYEEGEGSGRWRRLDVNRDSVVPVTDGNFKRILGAGRVRDLPGELEGYTVPRHVLMQGLPEAIEPPTGDLQRATQTVTADARAILWVRAPGGETYLPVMTEAEAAPLLFVRSADGWQRLIGDTRIDEPTQRVVRQSNQSFLDRLLPADLAELGEANGNGRREVRHTIYDGRLVPAHRDITDRDARRFRKPQEIFEVTLGESRTSHTTVMYELKNRLPVTLLLNLSAFPIIYIIAIPTGMLMALKRGKRFDGIANFFLLAFWSVPVVLSATLLIGYTAKGGLGVEWFPNNSLSSVGAEHWPFFPYVDDTGWHPGWLGDRFWHLVLPVSCAVYGGFAYLAKQMRAAMLENFTMDYVRTAKAKGVKLKDIVLRHVLRNSLIPLITIFATILPVLIAGSVFTEKIFNIEGMGLFAFRAVQNRDYDVVQSMALIFGILNLTGLLLADICYALVDPRITYK
jgi:peptide/nickel transport system permease protein